MKSVVTSARHDSEHLHMNMRSGGPQTVCLMHLLSARKKKNAYRILPLGQTVRHCVQYWRPEEISRLWGMQREKRQI